MNTIVETADADAVQMRPVSREEIQAMLAGRFNRRPSRKPTSLTNRERAELGAMWAGVATWLAVGSIGIVHLYVAARGA